MNEPVKDLLHLLARMADIKDYDNPLDCYTDKREVPGKGLCGIYRMAFTYGLFIEITDWSHGGRYCYEHYEDALKGLTEWNGEQHPCGPWIKFKGEVEIPGPGMTEMF